MIQNEARFNQLISEALAQDFSGWDFSFLRGRWQEDDLPWDYGALVRAHLQTVGTLLDMGTGGGEFFASLAPLPAFSAATEAWPPNIPVARARLEPLGVQIHTIDESGYLPAEVFRIVKPGGRFLTQQVGGRFSDCPAGTGFPQPAFFRHRRGGLFHENHCVAVP